MKLAVCVKLVPDTAHLKFDAQDALIRDGMEYMLNPFCEYAVETALRIKEALGDDSTVTVFTKGPAQSKDALKKALAMGCDDAYLVSDDAFDGGDGWTTAFLLSEAIKKQCGTPDLLLFGQFSTDDAMGLVGPQTAELMGMPSITFCKNVSVSGNTAKVERETEKGVEHYEMTLPGAVCTMKCDYEPRMPSIKGVMKANRTEIAVLDMAGLGVDGANIGAQGSLTTVAKLWRKPKKKGGHKVDGSDAQAAVSQLMAYLKEQKLV